MEVEEKDEEEECYYERVGWQRLITWILFLCMRVSDAAEEGAYSMAFCETRSLSCHCRQLLCSALPRHPPCP